MYPGLHVKYPFFVPDVSETWIFSADFRKNSMKIPPMGAELFQVDGQTDGCD
jgi:hypothetical protein